MNRRLWLGRILMRPAPQRRLQTCRRPALALLVVASIGGLLWLPPADRAQAQASQTTVWSATLTVDKDTEFHGCSSTDAYATLDDCSDSTVLTEDEFVYGGTTYTIDFIWWDSDQDELAVSLAGVQGKVAKSALSALKLHVDDTVFRVRRAKGYQEQLYWRVNPGWADGDTVALALTFTPPGKPAQPTGLAAAAGDGKVALTWTDPIDSSIERYQYQQRAGTAGWSGWEIITESVGQADATSYTVTGLDNGTAYQFRIRALNSKGISPRSDQTEPVTPRAADANHPTVTASSTGYYDDSALTTAPTGPQKAGAGIYTKVTFSEDMKHTKSNLAAARPELFYRIGSTDTQYDIVDNGDTLASGDCKPNHATNTNVYVCLYTVGSSADGAFRVKAGTASVDKANNALVSVYTHAATVILDTTSPGITFPSSPAVPRLGGASTIVLTDANAKIRRYGAIVVDGTTGAATDCDTAAKVGNANLTTLTAANASVRFDYTPLPGSLGKKVCAYAEDAVGNSHSRLWGAAIQSNRGHTYCGVALDKHPELRADCRTLLIAKPRLVGSSLRPGPGEEGNPGELGDLGDRRPRIAAEDSVNWSTSRNVEDWDGIVVGRVDGTKRITKIQMPAPRDGPTLFGVIPAELGQLTELRAINFTDQRLRGSIPAAIGRLPNLDTLFLGGNRLQANHPSHVLPEFKFPGKMERIRLTPNGWDEDGEPDNRAKSRRARRHPFDYKDGEGNVTRSCVPAVWVDADEDNDNLTKWSKTNLMGEEFQAEILKASNQRDPSIQPRFPPCGE